MRNHAYVLTPVLLTALSAVLLSACHGSDSPLGRVIGQSDFKSAPAGGSRSGNAAPPMAADMGAGGGAGTTTAAGSKSGSDTRTVEETDIYRLEGDRLYYLNAYRGLMVFDVSNPDTPKFLGRHAIVGSPVEMRVKNGIAAIVVADWYGKMEDGTPFHGSVIRSVDARDPANMQPLGEAQLGGWVRDTRVVGDVIYAVSEDQGWFYGWYPSGISNPQAKVMVTSVNVAGAPVRVGTYEDVGYGAVFNVTSESILFAHFVPDDPSTYWYSTGHSELRYVDISDPAGAIKPRGVLSVNMYLSDWASGADSGRWNLDFADKKTAHLVGCAQPGCSNYTYYGTGVGGGSADGGGTGGSGGGNTTDADAGQGAADSDGGTGGQGGKSGTSTTGAGATTIGGNAGVVLSTADFSDPDAPKLMSRLVINTTSSWSDPVARFTPGRMYLSPSSSYYDGNNNPQTPFQIYDLSDSANPKLAGSTTLAGSAWLFMPSEVTDASGATQERLFVVGNSYTANWDSSQVSVRYLDVTDAKAPTVLGAANFGQGWAWTPAAGTFKAFVKDDSQGLVLLPFAGWDYSSYKYNNGVQLIEFTPTSIRAAGAAFTKGWVTRGIFVKNRVVSLSDEALAVIDATDHDKPKTLAELTLARNIIDVRPNPQQATVAELSSDWWSNDKTYSELRVVSDADVEEVHSLDSLSLVRLEGYNARVFHNGSLAYVVTNVDSDGTCGDPATACTVTTQQVQVVDLSATTPKLLGKMALPPSQNYYGWYGWFDCFGWYGGDNIVQVEGNALAIRRWPTYYYGGNGVVNVDQGGLFLVDLKNPSSPKLSSTLISTDMTAWWGSLQVAGGKLYSSSYEWEDQSTDGGQNTESYVRYYLNQIDISDRSNPTIVSKINVPGVLVGGSSTDPSILYTIDYRWSDPNHWTNDFDVLKIDNGKAYLQKQITIEGDVGNVFVRGNRAFMSAETWDKDYTNPKGKLVQIDLSKLEVDFSEPKDGMGWGWLMAVEGDRAFVNTGWGGTGIDVYRLTSGAPVFDQTLPTQEYWSTTIARKGNRVYLGSGMYGVQAYDL